MKKLFLFAWLMMLSIVAMAQSFIVVDKNGNRTAYDPARITSVDFQIAPPGFIINYDDQAIVYIFEESVSKLS